MDIILSNRKTSICTGNIKANNVENNHKNQLNHNRKRSSTFISSSNSERSSVSISISDINDYMSKTDYVIYLRLIECKNLPIIDGSSNIYAKVKMTYGTHKFKTFIHKGGNKNPIWGDTFRIPLYDYKYSTGLCKIKIMSKNLIFKDTCIATVHLNLFTYINSTKDEYSFNLVSENCKNAKLRATINCLGSPAGNVLPLDSNHTTQSKIELNSSTSILYDILASNNASILKESSKNTHILSY